MASINKRPATRSSTASCASPTPSTGGALGAAVSALMQVVRRFSSATLTQGNERTHETGPAVQSQYLTPEAELRRAVMSCLLWEDRKSVV